MGKSLLVGVPAYGQIQYTHGVVGDLEREGVDYLIVDNKGDYEPIGHERVVTPSRNMGWAGGSNLIFRLGFSEGYDAVMTLNNDVRLSPGYFDGLLDPRLPDDVGAVCAVYDDRGGHPAMLSEKGGDAADYTPCDVYRELLAVDGTGLLLRRAAYLHTGGLDERSFGPFAWGADLDLCIRLRAAGFRIVATEMSYLNHFGRKTANVVAGRLRYRLQGGIGLSRGMKRLHGRRWRRKILTRQFEIIDLDSHRSVRTESAGRLWKATSA